MERKGGRIQWRSAILNTYSRNYLRGNEEYSSRSSGLLPYISVGRRGVNVRVSVKVSLCLTN
jgi:hypothetical protein